jgi:hypothetical protein
MQPAPPHLLGAGAPGGRHPPEGGAPQCQEPLEVELQGGSGGQAGRRVGRRAVRQGGQVAGQQAVSRDVMAGKMMQHAHACRQAARQGSPPTHTPTWPTAKFAPATASPPGLCSPRMAASPSWRTAVSAASSESTTVPEEVRRLPSRCSTPRVGALAADIAPAPSTAAAAGGRRDCARGVWRGKPSVERFRLIGCLYLVLLGLQLQSQAQGACKGGLRLPPGSDRGSRNQQGAPSTSEGCYLGTHQALASGLGSCPTLAAPAQPKPTPCSSCLRVRHSKIDGQAAEAGPRRGLP